MSQFIEPSRFIKVHAGTSERTPASGEQDTRYISIYAVDQVRDRTDYRTETIDGEKVSTKIPISILTLHDGGDNDLYLYVPDVTAVWMVQHIDALIRADQDYARLGPPKADEPEAEAEA